MNVGAMAKIVMDALSHQAIRQLGTEAQHYAVAPDSAGRWRGRRLVGVERSLARLGHAFSIAPPDAESLAQANVLIVASRSQNVPFSGTELDAIGAFVARGGGVLLMANHRHFVAPQQRLAEALGLPMQFNDVTIGPYPGIALDAHAVTSGCATLYVRNASSLAAGPEGVVLARFMADPQQLFAVAVAAGRGRVIATGDSGFIASLDDAGQAMFDAGSNARFFEGMIGWLVEAASR